MAYCHPPAAATTTTTTTYHYATPRHLRSNSCSHIPRQRHIPTYSGESDNVPWRGMTETYTWVAEQEFIQVGPKRGLKTEDWVREQQRFFNPKEASSRLGKTQRDEWEEVVYVYKVNADDWVRHEERARRVSAERERARQRIQEEVRRIEARFEERKQAERREREETRRRALAEMRVKQRKERVKMDKLMVDAWTEYEARWVTLIASSDELDFESIPWPLINFPNDVTDITQSAIRDFLFSPLHSQGMSHKERIKTALLRWHPDRFRRHLTRVKEGEKAKVEEGVGIVTRCLNSMMEKEKT